MPSVTLLQNSAKYFPLIPPSVWISSNGTFPAMKESLPSLPAGIIICFQPYTHVDVLHGKGKIITRADMGLKC